jgi:hypothetical protein
VGEGGHGAVGRGTSARQRGAGADDHRPLIDGARRMGEIEKELLRGNSPWVKRGQRQVMARDDGQALRGKNLGVRGLATGKL